MVIANAKALKLSSSIDLAAYKMPNIKGQRSLKGFIARGKNVRFVDT